MADLLWLEPVGGAAGDMFLAAALHLGVPRDELTRHLGALGVPGWRLEVKDAEASGIHGLHLDVEVEDIAVAQTKLRELARSLGIEDRVTIDTAL